MSLKAKLEAVIYAAEEPVTLNQLASLFAAEALEWKAEQAAAAAELAAEVAGEPAATAEHLPLLEEALQAPSAEPAEADAAELAEVLQATEAPAGPEDTESSAALEPAETLEAPPAAEGTVSEEEASPAPEAPLDPEAEARRVARLRDREIKAILKQLLDEIIAACVNDGRGVEVREIAGGYRMATKPECHDAVRMFVKSLKPPLKLSLPALETLAVVAYKQPVTAPEVTEIRGVESGGVLASLLSRKLIATAGRKQVIGRPILYKTTKEFLLRFGLKDLSELPSMEEFEKMAGIEIEQEMEPEAAAIDAAQAAAEAEADAQAAAEAEAALEENSPSGEEMADQFSASAGTDQEAEPSDESEQSEDEGASDQEAPAVTEEEPTAATADATESATAPSNPTEAAPAEPDSNEQAEIEASSHAEEEQEKY